MKHPIKYKGQKSLILIKELAHSCMHINVKSTGCLFKISLGYNLNFDPFAGKKSDKLPFAV